MNNTTKNTALKNPKIGRPWRLTGEVNRMTINGEDYFDVADLNNATLYASPYLVVNRQEYTKHIYAGSKRIVSKLGVGLESSIVDPLVFTVEYDGEYGELGTALHEYLNNNLSCTDIKPENVSRNFDLEVISENHVTPASEVESDIYFYHTDHLGSSSWITYTDGSVTQHMQNLPFGEPFIDQRATSYDIRYKFTGKEMDSETGYQYFGARYYNSDISVWLSVDPKANHFPHISSYNYVEQNPLKYIDKKGENPIGALVGGLIGGAKEIVSQTISNGFANMENGDKFFSNWGKNMDWGDVGITTVEGALIGSGVGAAFVPLIEGGAAVARSGFDWKGNDKTPNVIFGKGDYKKDWAEFGYDIAGEVLSLGLEYGSGLNKIKFTDYNHPDFSGALTETLTKGVFDGLYNSPSAVGKRSYTKNRDKIFDYGSLPEVEIVAPSSKNYCPSENNFRLYKKYYPWLMK